MASSDEVVAERTALARDFQHLADLADALTSKMQQAQEGLTRLESDAQQLHASAVGSIGRFDQLVDLNIQNVIFTLVRRVAPVAGDQRAEKAVGLRVFLIVDHRRSMAGEIEDQCVVGPCCADLGFKGSDDRLAGGADISECDRDSVG